MVRDPLFILRRTKRAFSERTSFSPNENAQYVLETVASRLERLHGTTSILSRQTSRQLTRSMSSHKLSRYRIHFATLLFEEYDSYLRQNLFLVLYLFWFIGCNLIYILFLVLVKDFTTFIDILGQISSPPSRGLYDHSFTFSTCCSNRCYDSRDCLCP